MLRCLAAASVVAAAASAHAVELNYQWKKGDVHRFAYEDTTHIDMKMPGMPMPAGGMDMRVQSTFSEKVLSVGADGTAQVELTVEKMDVQQGGKTIATIAQLPPAARVVKAEIDRKGHATFFRMVTVYMKDDQVYLGVETNKSGTGGRATASAGGETVELVASIDPKTGTVTASVTTKKEEPKLKAVEVKEEDPSVDVLPKDILAMMVLPDGDMPPGSQQSMHTMLGDVTFGLSALDKGVGQMSARMDGNKVETSEKGMKATKKNGAKAAVVPSMDGMGGMPDMSGMMGGMTGMPGMPGMDDSAGEGGMPSGMPMGPGGGGAGGMGSAGMQMDFDVVGGFDTTKGRLLSMSGSAHQTIEMGGMGSMKIDQKFKLTRQ